MPNVELSVRLARTTRRAMTLLEDVAAARAQQVCSGFKQFDFSDGAMGKLTSA